MTAPTGRPRLLIYSQDGLGLGHLRRTTLLAAEFLAARPGATALTISDSPVGPFFSPAAGHDHVKLPSIRKIAPGDWSPVSLSMGFGDVLALRRQMIRATALGFRPDVLLVDHMPHGAMGELVPTLQALAGTPARVVLGLRDILDAPRTIRRRWRVEGAFEAVERHYDDVLVYGSRDVFDVAAEYAWPAALRSRLHYCGYICSAGPPPAVAGTRSRLPGAAADGDLVVAMAGGGADAHTLFDTVLRAVPALTAERRCSVVVVTGPFLPYAERRALQRLARGLPVHLASTVADPLSYLAAADLVVAMAGYNTTAEILAVARRALLVPRPGPSAEQRMRASRFAERGWVRWLPPARLSVRALADAMLDTLTASPGTRSTAPDLGGRRQAVAHLLSTLERRDTSPAPGSESVPTGSGRLVPGGALGEGRR
jgi:predicted glycosyltransferase